MTPPSITYDASSISVLAGLEAVRQHPTMYVGSTGAAGLHHLVAEVVGNAIDEALSGFCTRIGVTIHRDGSCSVEDNGRGIPVEPHPSNGRPACEVVLTTLHAGSKFNPGSYQFAGGLHGIGVSCVNALSEWLVLDVWRGGHHYRQRYARGNVESALQEISSEVGESDKRGTRIHFLPDTEIFTHTVDFSYDLLVDRLRELAFLSNSLTVELSDLRVGKSHVYEGNGVCGLVQYLNESRRTLHDFPIRIEGQRGEIAVDLALQWTTAYAEDIHSYANSIRTLDGGTHVTGLVSALSRTINDYAAAQNLIDVKGGEKITGLDIFEGLTCGLSIRMPDPEFEGQTKTRLHTTAAGVAVEDVVMEQLGTRLSEDGDLAAVIVGRAIEATRARIAARRASELARYQIVDAGFDEEVYQKQFGIRSETWHDSCAWITAADLLQAHADLCQVPANGKMLDVCCGSGVVGASFDGRVGEKIGLDLTPEMADLARERLDEVHLGTVYDLPFDKGTFDLVVTREVLHILPFPEKPVAQIFRVLKPGGQFIVGTTLTFGKEDAAWMWRIFKKKQPLLFTNWQKENFEGMLRDAGFVNIQMKELLVWEDIDLWIDTHETTNLHRHEIRRLYYDAPEIVRTVHPFEVSPTGAIRDCWRWGVFTGFKPG